MLEQQERDKAELGIIRVLMGASRQRLVAIRRHRDHLRRENARLVEHITTLETQSMQRIADQLQRHARFATSAMALEGRGAAEREEAKTHAVNSSPARMVADLREELAVIMDEIGAVRSQIASLEAHYHRDGDPLVTEDKERLWQEIESVRETHSLLEQQLETQRDASRLGYATVRAQHMQSHANRIAKVCGEELSMCKGGE